MPAARREGKCNADGSLPALVTRPRFSRWFEWRTKLRALYLRFDVRFVAQAAQPQLCLFVGLAGADGIHGLVALQLVGVVKLTAAQQLRQCANRTAYGRAR